MVVIVPCSARKDGKKKKEWTWYMDDEGHKDGQVLVFVSCGILSCSLFFLCFSCGGTEGGPGTRVRQGGKEGGIKSMRRR